MHSFLSHITANPRILSGKPVIKKSRIPVSIILQMLRDRSTFDQIIEEYPRLTIDDIKAALDYSMYLVEHPKDDEESLLLQKE